MSIKVLVVDDHEVIRVGLMVLFSGTEIEIVAEASSGSQVLPMAKRHKPDVVLLDVRMPDMDGLDVLERLRKELPATRVIMLSAYDNPTYVARALVLGAAEYLLKGSTRAELHAAVRAVAAGKDPAKNGELRRVSTAMNLGKELGRKDNPLTPRETQVMRHLALGLSNKEIAQSLQISLETVKEHVENILRKLAVANRTKAAIWAVRHGFM